jgi:signal transduction histidine kinase/DNA-binding response OmpR family regulator
MSGLEDNWVYLDKAQTIIFSNLPHGKYQFRIKASNNDGVWNEQGDYINITILPPFWKSKLAYILYILMLLYSVAYLLKSNNRRLKRKSENARILFEKEKEKEIYHAKISFFTNIAHEIRTPLTLIKSPLEYILSNKTDENELKSNLQVMEKNTDRLLLLINQLLDFRKIESKSFSLTFVRTDIARLLEETYVRFHPLAINRGLDFRLQMPSEKVLADVDKEAITKIISNLLSNAIKYGKSSIDTSLSLSETEFQVRVNSDGKTIPYELKEQIFEPFFQIREHNVSSKTGSGIGLALAKSLAELHKGSVRLDTSVSGLNSFLLCIPLAQEKSIVLNEPAETSDILETLPADDAQNDKERVLIVEDDEDLLSFMMEKLSKTYSVLSARNGKEAVHFLEKEIVNIVISDIVMPEMDGLELCRKMKSDVDYSHIPVILLTAKTTIQNKIEGLDSGADAYIEKPFSLDYLHAQMANLLNNRKKIREAFAHSPLVQTESMALNKADEVFLRSMNDIILKNISDPGFHVEDLAKSLCMSRSSLLRKIRGLSEFSPNDFIKVIRLKKAAEILQEGEYKINEVCFLVGFSSTSYFTKAFQKQFGILPKDFARNSKRAKIKD